MADRRLVERIGALYFRGMDKLRDRRAFEVADRAPTGHDFARFDTARQCLLVTYRRSGEPVPSPVNLGLSDGKLYLRTDASTGKVKRLRRDQRVVVVPCGLRGKPLGPSVSATARILPDAEVAHADSVIAANWSPPMRLIERLLDLASKRFDVPMVHVEITPDASVRGPRTTG